MLCQKKGEKISGLQTLYQDDIAHILCKILKNENNIIDIFVNEKQREDDEGLLVLFMVPENIFQ